MNFALAEQRSLDFSNTPKLKEVVFRVRTQTVRWMTLALQTITPDHRDFRQISIHVPKPYRPIANPPDLRQGSVYNQWMDLDRLLVQLWESRGIRPKVLYEASENKEAMGEHIGCLFPEITERGIIELADYVKPRIPYI